MNSDALFLLAIIIKYWLKKQHRPMINNIQEKLMANCPELKNRKNLLEYYMSF